jgi:hypothetical protein
LPAWAGTLALHWLDNRQLSRIARLSAHVGLNRFDWITRADDLAAPTIVFHGSVERSASMGIAAQLRDRRLAQVRLERFDADHAMAWNSDPERWRKLVATELSDLVGR